MPRLRALVVDDEPLGCARMVRLLGAFTDVAIMGQCHDGELAVSAMRTLAPDVVFLDIQMQGMNGFEALRQLAPEQRPIVVFVTAHERHAVEAFEVCAADYLLKPVALDRLARALTHVRERLIHRERPNHMGPLSTNRLAVRKRDGIRFIEHDVIDYCVSEGNYVRVHMADEIVTLRETMHGLEQRLVPWGFVRIHRCCLVRIACIRELSPLANGEQRVLLHNGVVLDSGRSYRGSLRAALGLDTRAR